MQWAAVSSQSRPITEAPQAWRSFQWRDTIQGQAPFAALTPPTTLPSTNEGDNVFVKKFGSHTHQQKQSLPSPGISSADWSIVLDWGTTPQAKTHRGYLLLPQRPNPFTIECVCVCVLTLVVTAKWNHFVTLAGFTVKHMRDVLLHSACIWFDSSF